MELVTYLKQFTREERGLIAASVGAKPSYIEKLKTGAGSASIGLFSALLRSDFNNALPRSLRLKKADEVRYRKLKSKARV